MHNRICTEMNWPVPGEGQTLLLSLGSRQLGYLLPERPDAKTYKAVYVQDVHGVSNPAYSVTSAQTRPDQIRRGLAQKLRVGISRLDEIKALVSGST